ncbi:MAG: VTT domain-containing protein [Halobaculum sp.]
MFRRRLLAGVVVCGAVAVAALSTSPAAVLDDVTALAADPVRFFLVLLLLAAVRPFLAWPTSLLSLLAGYAYGLPGVVPAVALLTITSVPPYLFGQRGRAELLAGDGRLAEAVGRIDTAGERAVAVAGAFRSVTVARLAPLPSDVVSGAAGVSGIAVWPYLAGTAVGEIPWAVGAAVAGASARRVATSGLSAAFDLRLILAAGLAGLLLLVGPLYRHYGEETADSVSE